MIPGKTYTPELMLQMGWRRKWWIVVPTVIVAVAVALWTRTLHDQYRSDTVILVVPQQVPEEYVKSTVTATVTDRLQSISQQILSRTRLERIILDLNLYPVERRTGIMEDIVDNMRASIAVQTVKGDAFQVSFTSEDPRTAMRVTERLGSLFIDESLRDREVLAEGTNQFLEAQLEDARRQLVDNEKRLEEFRRSHDGQLPTQLEANMQGVHNIEMQLQSLLDSANRDRDQREALRRDIAELESNDYVQPPAAGAQAAPLTAADRLRAAEADLAAMQQRFKPDHPDVIRGKKIVADMKKAADEEAAAAPVSAEDAQPVTVADRLRRSRLNAAREELIRLDRDMTQKAALEKQLRQAITDYQKRIEATPTRQSELIELTRDYSTLQATYQGLLAKKQDSQISANLERRQIGEQFRVLDPARLPARPFTPNRPRFYASGLIGGLALGLALAAFFEYLDKTIRSEDDVKAVLNLPVLAAVPLLFEDALIRRHRILAASAVGAVSVIGAAAFVAWRYLR